MNKWLTTQAVSPLESTLDTVIRLSRDPVFDKNNPNKIYSLFSAFSRFNPLRFHDRSGAGYRFIADQVLDIDARNPQVAARLMGGFGQWRHFDAGRQQLMKAELGRILAQPKLSANVFEMASKMLNDN
jgi:aminopeptidase N